MPLTDKQLKQIPAKDFKQKTGMTKAQYRNIRAFYCMMKNTGTTLTIWVPEGDKRDLIELLGKGIDVLYVTRMQTERHPKEINETRTA